MLRDFLTKVVQEKESRHAAATDLDDIIRTSKLTLGLIIWTRDELHERGDPSSGSRS
ncbi:MAG: hypothetical protein JO307_04135 [Bryobacterales bacterium]|nr:hypothetical protein [Bryobacterales bacterium]